MVHEKMKEENNKKYPQCLSFCAVKISFKWCCLDFLHAVDYITRQRFTGSAPANIQNELGQPQTRRGKGWKLLELIKLIFIQLISIN